MSTQDANITLADEMYPEHHAREIHIAKQVSEVLEKHYPGYMWGVNVNLPGGMVDIKALRLSGVWGCYIKLASIINDPYMTKVKEYGGEILERYRVSRSAADTDQILSLERDRFGRFAVDAA